ncbi:Serine/threonine-protein kinase SIK3-like protein [Yarrowia sp. C11]|nr:Serine/threonine-protein kinase SIK3-like protein [Yarrowia sp. C11]KAG5364343.1 Serine/threonine-protein kinase SIK3-like protein [Yarrowia sp. E02]
MEDFLFPGKSGPTTGITRNTTDVMTVAKGFECDSPMQLNSPPAEPQTDDENDTHMTTDDQPSPQKPCQYTSRFAKANTFNSLKVDDHTKPADVVGGGKGHFSKLSQTLSKSYRDSDYTFRERVPFGESDEYVPGMDFTQQQSDTKSDTNTNLSGPASVTSPRRSDTGEFRDISTGSSSVDLAASAAASVDWKSLPFSTRKKLRSAIAEMQMSPLNTVSSPMSISHKDDQIANSLFSPQSFGQNSYGGSVGPPPAIPFSKRRSRNNTLLNSTQDSASSVASSPAQNFLAKFSSPSVSRSASVNMGHMTSLGSQPEGCVAGTPNGNADFSLAADALTGEEIGRYTLGQKIGYGGFSDVYEADCKALRGEEPSKTKACKVVKKKSSQLAARTSESDLSGMESSDSSAFNSRRNSNSVGSTHDTSASVIVSEEHLQMLQEVNIWRTLRHPNVLDLEYVYEDSRAIYCFTSKIMGGTLFDLVKHNRQGIDVETARQYAFQLACAMSYMHESMHIVHRDIKLENCLLDPQDDGSYNLLVCDFGMSDYINQDEEHENSRRQNRPIGPSTYSSTLRGGSTTANGTATPVPSTPSSQGGSVKRDNLGSLPYAAPELLSTSEPIYHPSVDIWSYGVVVYALLVGNLPFTHSFVPKLRGLIQNAQWDRELLKSKLGDDDDDWLELLEMCLTVDPEERASVRQVLTSSVFESLAEALVSDTQ